MTLRDALNRGRTILREHSETPYLDSLVILQYVLKSGKEKIYSRLEEPCAEGQEKLFFELIRLRAEGVPAAYLVKHREFYSREFYVEPGVLIPRPDTEILIEAALSIIESDPGIKRIHDVCTGSGCIAVTIKAERPEIEVSASDISEDSRRVFAINSEGLLGYRLPFYRCSYLSDVPGLFDMILSNPPYLNAKETKNFIEKNPSEPSLAIDGGKDGLEPYRLLLPRVVEHLDKNGYLILETDYRRMAKLADLYRNAGFSIVRVVKDLGQRDRVIIFKKNNLLG